MKLSLLQSLCTLPGPPGYEKPVCDFLLKEWHGHLSDIGVDGFGNLLGIKNCGKSLNILIMAHMDEVGLIVRDVTEDGYVHFDALGGQLDEMLAGQLWHIHTEYGTVPAYSGLESGHTILTFPSVPKVDQRKFFLDIGVNSRQAAYEKGVRPGVFITYGGPGFMQLNDHRILARALDDRFGIAVMTELLQTLKDETLPCNILFAATCQEELGMRGSKVIYNSFQPDLVLNLDIGFARDYPLILSQSTTAPQTSNTPQLGKGFTMMVYDTSVVVNPQLVNYLIAQAKALNIPYQLDSTTMGSQDASCLQQSGVGLPVINMGIPVRYAHSPLGIMDSRDYDTLLKMLIHFCKTYTPEIHQKLFGAPKLSVTALNNINNRNQHTQNTQDTRHTAKL